MHRISSQLTNSLNITEQAKFKEKVIFNELVYQQKQCLRQQTKYKSFLNFKTHWKCSDRHSDSVLLK